MVTRREFPPQGLDPNVNFNVLGSDGTKMMIDAIRNVLADDKLTASKARDFLLPYTDEEPLDQQQINCFICFLSWFQENLMYHASKYA